MVLVFTDENRFRVDGIINDEYRIEFMKEHLNYLREGNTARQ